MGGPPLRGIQKEPIPGKGMHVGSQVQERSLMAVSQILAARAAATPVSLSTLSSLLHVGFSRGRSMICAALCPPPPSEPDAEISRRQAPGDNA